MWRSVLVGVLVCCAQSMVAVSAEMTEAEAAVDQVLSNLHRAASDADGDLYFSLFSEDAVFLGTDSTERWSVAEFRAFAEPYFSGDRGWTYTMKERHIFIQTTGITSWFDEVLWNETYGTCRGTGVLVLTDGGWRIAQYSLSIPIPNDITKDLTSQIKEFEGHVSN